MSGAEPTDAAGDSRCLGFWMSTALVVGNIIGVGIFVMPAVLAPYGLNAIRGWLVTVLGCACLAVSFATLARHFPRDDGPYDYTLRAFGPATAFLVMWCYWISVWFGNAAIAVGVAGYILYFLRGSGADRLLPPLIGLALLWGFVLVNLRGARVAGWMQVLSTILKLVPQAAVILLGLVLLVAHPHAYLEHLPPNPASWREVASVSAIALFAMLGLECAVIPAGRVRDPQRTIPRATLAGTLVAAAIYISISVVPMLLIPQQELGAATAPFADLFARLLGGHWGAVIAAFVVISGLGALNGWTLVVGQVTQTMARHDGFPRWLAHENEHGAPARALVVSGLVASVSLLGNYAGSVAELFAFLTAMAVYIGMPLYLAGALGVVLLQRARTLPSARLLTTAAVFAAVYCVWVMYGIEARVLLWGLGLGVLGVPLYLRSLYVRKRAAPSLGSEVT